MELLEVLGSSGGGLPTRSVPTSPCPRPREDRLQVISKLEKCLSENSLLHIGRGDDGNQDSDNNIIGEERTGCGVMTGVRGCDGGGGVEEQHQTSSPYPGAGTTLILPRKLPNPCLENRDRKELHRELLLNQKLGKNVLGGKSELQKAMEKHKEQVIRKELEAQRLENMTPFEKVIEQRAKRLEILEKDLNEKEMSPKEPEFLQIHAKLRARMDAK